MRQLRKLEDLTGYHLHARDGEIGKLKQVYFDDQHWTVRYFVVHTGTWLLGRDVLIAPATFTAIDEENKRIEVDLTQEQIKNSPPVESEKTVSRHYEEGLIRHYQWERYWIDATLYGVPQLPKGERSSKARFSEKPEHPHLRSSSEVKKYKIQALDGGIGHVADYILEEPGWVIRYMEIATRDFLSGRHILIAPDWVREIDWADNTVSVDLVRDTIEKAPPYDLSMIISRGYLAKLYTHYGKELEED